MLEGTKRLIEGEPLEPAMSIDDFVNFGLEPGQHALVWDFEAHKYVPVTKGRRPPGLLVQILTTAAGLGMVHGLAAISLIGGYRS